MSKSFNCLQGRWFVCVLASILSGCIGWSYPSEWAPRDERVHSCAEISGNYRNAGESKGDHEYGAPLLSGYLRFASNETISPEMADAQASGNASAMMAQIRKFREDQGKLKVRIDVGADGVATFALIRGSATGDVVLFDRVERSIACANGELTWSTGTKSTLERGSPIVGLQSESLEITKGLDGFLYVKGTSSGAGLAYLFFPVAVSERNWIRFAPAAMN